MLLEYEHAVSLPRYSFFKEKYDYDKTIMMFVCRIMCMLYKCFLLTSSIVSLPNVRVVDISNFLLLLLG